ncbi:MAG: ATP-binding protein, partial [Colwellia sp.]
GNTIILAFKNMIPTLRTDELLAMGIELQETMNIPMEQYAKLLAHKLQ